MSKLERGIYTLGYQIGLSGIDTGLNGRWDKWSNLREAMIYLNGLMAGQKAAKSQ